MDDYMLHLCISRLIGFTVRYIDKLDHQDANGQTACHLAALNGEVKCVKILLEQGDLN